MVLSLTDSCTPHRTAPLHKHPASLQPSVVRTSTTASCDLSPRPVAGSMDHDVPRIDSIDSASRKLERLATANTASVALATGCWQPGIALELSTSNLHALA